MYRFLLAAILVNRSFISWDRSNLVSQSAHSRKIWETDVLRFLAYASNLSNLSSSIRNVTDLLLFFCMISTSICVTNHWQTPTISTSIFLQLCLDGTLYIKIFGESRSPGDINSYSQVPVFILSGSPIRSLASWTAASHRSLDVIGFILSPFLLKCTDLGLCRDLNLDLLFQPVSEKTHTRRLNIQPVSSILIHSFSNRFDIFERRRWINAPD